MRSLLDKRKRLEENMEDSSDGVGRTREVASFLLRDLLRLLIMAWLDFKFFGYSQPTNIAWSAGRRRLVLLRRHLVTLTKREVEVEIL